MTLREANKVIFFIAMKQSLREDETVGSLLTKFGEALTEQQGLKAGSTDLLENEDLVLNDNAMALVQQMRVELRRHGHHSV